MANKAAVDFGNSNTVFAVWNERIQNAEVLDLPEFSSPGSFLIPSLIAYEPDGRFYPGIQSEKKASPEAKLFRWMKRYISLRSPYTLRIGESRVDARQAAEDFLKVLLRTVFPGSDDQPDQLMVSVPVESFEHYSEWLMTGLQKHETIPVRLIDEASAAAAGYGLNLHPGNTLLVVDFGGSTLQAVCVSVMEEGTKQGRCCRVLGKSGVGTGGMTLDRWICEEAMKRLGVTGNEAFFRNCSGEFLRYCESFKMALSEKEQSVFDFFPDRSFSVTREEEECLFRDRGLFGSLDTVLNEAIRSAQDHGMDPDGITAVLPVGGSCLIPAVRDHLEKRFSPEKIAWGEPLGAVARGAAVIAGGMHIYDFIQHHYAVRYTDPYTGDYAFRTIIEKGTKYPAEQVTPKMKLKAAYDGQSRFGIAIYELREESGQPVGGSEIFFDSDGSAHVMPLTEEETRSEKLFWMNERTPLFLRLDDPAEKGEQCFIIAFGIDENKMLTVTASEAQTGREVLSNHPVVRLV